MIIRKTSRSVVTRDDLGNRIIVNIKSSVHLADNQLTLFGDTAQAVKPDAIRGTHRVLSDDLSRYYGDAK